MIGVGEEVLNVGTRMVAGKTTRVRRVVVQAPVQQDVTLHTETVVLERRKPISSNGNEVLTEVTVEMSDFNEVPVVSKAVHLVEEVLLRKEVTARTETIHDTVRRDKLEIEQPSNVPVVFQAAAKQEEKMREESASADSHDKKSLINPAQTSSRNESRPKARAVTVPLLHAYAKVKSPEGPPAGAALSLGNWFCRKRRQGSLLVKRKARSGSE